MGAWTLFDDEDGNLEVGMGKFNELALGFIVKYQLNWLMDWSWVVHIGWM